MKSEISIYRLTYSELLATIPWVALRSTTDERCEKVGCKTNGKLIYFNLDGTSENYCYHHLGEAKFDDDFAPDPDNPERIRNKNWAKRCRVSRGVGQ